jgi:hypothetical protein
VGQYFALISNRARKRELTRTARGPLDRTECDNGGSRDDLGASTEPSTENPTGPSAITAGRGPASTRSQLGDAGLVREPNPSAFPSGRELSRESSLGASTELSTEVGVEGKTGHAPYL